MVTYETFGTTTPFQHLLNMYDLTFEEFSLISGIPYSLTVTLCDAINPGSAAMHKHPAYSKVSELQYQRISDFFEIPISHFADSVDPPYIFINKTALPTVQHKIRVLRTQTKSNTLAAAYDGDIQKALEAIAEVAAMTESLNNERPPEGGVASDDIS